jgi:hypothetical protein
MKHLLNDMSLEEKNSIREQHTGGIQIDTTKFKTLLETKLGDTKPLISEEEDDSVVVDETKIDADDMKCFDSISAEEAKKVGLNHGGKYKVKKKGCKTKVRYKGPKTKYRGSNWP